ncbi:MAG TPA: hypothetical protein VGX16_04640 [Solirubrobacteraceae bacterium]|nr:hypothetical protein [Solirubrobacteraceae bacterium]
MRFVDFLKATVLLSAAAATALATVTALTAAGGSHTALALGAAGWWSVATLVGLRLGRREQASEPIARLLASAKASSVLPEQNPGVTLLNRLWPLLLFAVLAGALAVVGPQIPGIGAGFAIIWALAWRRQHAAVQAIEERDGVRFYVLRTSPIRPIVLQRAPGFKALRPERVGRVAG